MQSTLETCSSNQSSNEISYLMGASHSFCPSWNFVEHNKVFRRENCGLDQKKRQKRRNKKKKQIVMSKMHVRRWQVLCDASSKSVEHENAYTYQSLNRISLPLHHIHSNVHSLVQHQFTCFIRQQYKTYIPYTMYITQSKSSFKRKWTN